MKLEFWGQHKAVKETSPWVVWYPRMEGCVCSPSIVFNETCTVCQISLSIRISFVFHSSSAPKTQLFRERVAEWEELVRRRHQKVSSPVVGFSLPAFWTCDRTRDSSWCCRPQSHFFAWWQTQTGLMCGVYLRVTIYVMNQSFHAQWYMLDMSSALCPFLKSFCDSILYMTLPPLLFRGPSAGLNSEGIETFDSDMLLAIIYVQRCPKQTLKHTACQHSYEWARVPGDYWIATSGCFYSD